MEKGLSPVKENVNNLVIQDHYLIKKLYFLNRFTSNKCTIYSSLKKKKYFFQDYLVKKSLIITIFPPKYLLLSMHCHTREQIKTKMIFKVCKIQKANLFKIYFSFHGHVLYYHMFLLVFLFELFFLKIACGSLFDLFF